jgi:hypothetical protein
MNKKLSFDDEDSIHVADDMYDADDTPEDDPIPAGKITKIIDEFESDKDDFDDDADENITLDSLGLR